MSEPIERRGRATLIDKMMAEYIPMGGPVLTRAEAYAHLTRLGITGEARDFAVFRREAVAAPDDPEAHIAFAREIERKEAGR